MYTKTNVYDLVGHPVIHELLKALVDQNLYIFNYYLSEKQLQLTGNNGSVNDP